MMRLLHLLTFQLLLLLQVGKSSAFSLLDLSSANGDVGRHGRCHAPVCRVEGQQLQVSIRSRQVHAGVWGGCRSQSFSNVQRLARADDGYDEKDSMSSSFSSTNQTLVTREIFQRDLLLDPVVKRSKGGKNSNNNNKSSGYKILDNRDSLPFRVEHVTPDPYTHPDVKRKKMKKVPRRPGSIEEGLLSSVYDIGGVLESSNDKLDGKTMVGEFVLDKHTTTGDLLEIGDMQYKVVRHKCQYKYAGGKRFVMIRKILQVKEIGRILQEEYLTRQWEQSPVAAPPGSSSENI
ncbi:hypothetical protein ACA910_015819 [Epithemia clementina (nom. ined.)]